MEILINDPYTDGPGGNGQYTHKIYHVGSHLPGWFKSLLPKSALTVEEEAWNAYPYTKTRYKCPFVEKYVITNPLLYFLPLLVLKVVRIYVRTYVLGAKNVICYQLLLL